MLDFSSNSKNLKVFHHSTIDHDGYTIDDGLIMMGTIDHDRIHMIDHDGLIRLVIISWCMIDRVN